jgi:hypothetical protein
MLIPDNHDLLCFHLFVPFYFELELVELDLIRIELSTQRPRACQKSIIGNPKITGINQFHNHIVGNAKSTE